MSHRLIGDRVNKTSKEEKFLFRHPYFCLELRAFIPFFGTFRVGTRAVATTSAARSQ